MEKPKDTNTLTKIKENIAEHKCFNIFQVCLFILAFIFIGIMSNFPKESVMDVDYWIFTDAAKYVYLKGESPYNRATYRYSPLVAYLFGPNIVWFEFMRYVLLFGGLLMCANRAYMCLLELSGDKVKSVLMIALSPFWILQGHLSFRGSIDIILSILVYELIIRLKRGQYDTAAIIYGLITH